MIILFCSVAWIRLPILIISDPFQRERVRRPAGPAAARGRRRRAGSIG
jgi:hypothetical protein